MDPRGPWLTRSSQLLSTRDRVTPVASSSGRLPGYLPTHFRSASRRRHVTNHYSVVACGNCRAAAQSVRNTPPIREGAMTRSQELPETHPRGDDGVAEDPLLYPAQHPKARDTPGSSPE